MPTFTALTTLAGRDSAEALGAAMERLAPEPTGIGVFEIEDGSGLWEVGGYFTAPPDTAALALLAAAFGAQPFVVSELPETDWVAKVRRELAPVRAGRFFVYGGHDADHVPAGTVPLLIEASMAFGTGHHGTTLGCLRAYDRLLTAGHMPGSVADIGCGTAVLALAAAKTRAGPTVASDIDPTAVDVARANLRANDAADAVTTIVADGFDHDLIRDAAPFDLIFANILKGPLIALAPAVAQHLNRQGFAILSGILADQVDEVVAVYRQHGVNEFDREIIVDWATLTLTRTAP